MDPIVLASVAATWLIKKLLDRLGDAAVGKLLQALGSEGVEVKPLVDALGRARLVLGAVPAGAAAGTKIGNEHLVEQINQVHRLAADLTKNLDELEYYDLMDKVKKKKKNPKNSNVFKSKPIALFGQSKFSKADLQHIRDTVKDLHSICDDVHNALLLEKLDGINRATQNASADIRETPENFTEDKVFSREEKDVILKVINCDASNDQELLVLPIFGDGGVGKTTLARLVYHDPEVKAKFGIMIWIHVSANFDEVKLTQGILEQIPECEYRNTKNLTVLQRGITKYLTKRFLLVLDDMWEESEGRWDKLLAPFRSTHVKGVILVTTRKLSVARITSKIAAPLNLDGMKKDEFLLFFKMCIFGDENYRGQRKLLKIAEEIATRLNGNPLAAKSVGTLLKRNVNEGYWRRILYSDEWRLQEKADDIIPALKLSYNHLPFHLQLLFSYCAMFPKGYNFDKEELVHTWIALGFVTNNRKRLEDEGGDCFDDLVDRSFFLKYGQYFIVHDLMHDVAQEVSMNKCLIIDGSDLQKVSPYISHLGIWTGLAYNEQSLERNDNFEEKLDIIQDNDCALRSLESLILEGVYEENFSAKFVQTLKKLHYVRLLRLSARPFNAKKLLCSINQFIHLRYLELRCDSADKPDMPETLPDDICMLYLLQVLDIKNWRDLHNLPKDFSNLVNLRYLFVSGSGSLHSKISRVGELKFLQELKEFNVQDADGFKISQLGNLKEIRGSLSILGLENVTKKEEAACARIKDKRLLTALKLSWGRAVGSPSVQKEVLEGLKPHEDLCHLQLINYPGATPSWLGEKFSLGNLESLHIQDCAEVKTLPPFEEMPYLKTLSLVGMSSLKDVRIDFNHDGANTATQSSADDEFELSEIEISNCSNLKYVKLHSCKALTKLSIKDCKALTSVEGLPSSLRYGVEGCPQLSN